MRKSVGITVFFGMIGVTLFGLLFTPVFYAFVRRFSERGHQGKLQLALDSNKAEGI